MQCLHRPSLQLFRKYRLKLPTLTDGVTKVHLRSLSLNEEGPTTVRTSVEEWTRRTDRVPEGFPPLSGRRPKSESSLGLRNLVGSTGHPRVEGSGGTVWRGVSEERMVGLRNDKVVWV